MKFFQTVMEIRSRAGVLHFRRFAIFQFSWIALYIHTIFQPDRDDHLHSHPWNFFTVVLRGSYMALGRRGREMKEPGSISWMTRAGFHKIEEIIHGPVTTLFLTVGRPQTWYYLVDGVRIDSDTYRKIKKRDP